MHWAIAEETTRTDREIRNGLSRPRVTAALLTHSGDRIVIRRSAPGDGPAIGNLAILDDREWAGGPALVAEVDGSLRAALPLDGGESFADPFYETEEIAALLELRAEQLGRQLHKPRRSRFLPHGAVAR
jgi:hypothetical protein